MEDYGAGHFHIPPSRRCIWQPMQLPQAIFQLSVMVFNNIMSVSRLVDSQRVARITCMMPIIIAQTINRERARLLFYQHGCY